MICFNNALDWHCGYLAAFCVCQGCLGTQQIDCLVVRQQEVPGIESLLRPDCCQGLVRVTLWLVLVLLVSSVFNAIYCDYVL
jgi:hypothetical protein